MFGLLLESHCAQETSWKMEKFSVQSVMSDLRRKWWTTGYIALNVKDGGMSGVLWLNETSYITAGFAKHLFLGGDILCIFKKKCTEECALTMFPFFIVCRDRNVTVRLCLCKHAAHRSLQHLQDTFCFPTSNNGFIKVCMSSVCSFVLLLHPLPFLEFATHVVGFFMSSEMCLLI
jgi:hypothetical protein